MRRFSFKLVSLRPQDNLGDFEFHQNRTFKMLEIWKIDNSEHQRPSFSALLIIGLIEWGLPVEPSR